MKTFIIYFLCFFRFFLFTSLPLSLYAQWTPSLSEQKSQDTLTQNIKTQHHFYFGFELAPSSTLNVKNLKILNSTINPCSREITAKSQNNWLLNLEYSYFPFDSLGFGSSISYFFIKDQSFFDLLGSWIFDVNMMFYLSRKVNLETGLNFPLFELSKNENLDLKSRMGYQVKFTYSPDKAWGFYLKYLQLNSKVENKKVDHDDILFSSDLALSSLFFGIHYQFL